MKIGRPIRLSPPSRMRPLYGGNTIGVGESIGCVFPITGEGIVPSLICCDIFLDVLEMDLNKFDFQQYENRILETFSYYEDAYRIMRLMMNERLDDIIGQIQDLKQLVINNPIYANAIKEAANIMELISIINAIARNLEYPIYSHDELTKKIGKTKMGESVVLSNLKHAIPLTFFPANNHKDLENVLLMLKEKFEKQLVFTRLLYEWYPPINYKA
jgi:hypothetical protein